MKQTIEYYYSLKIDNLYVEGETYHFVYEEDDYYFVFCNRTLKDLNDIVECSRELKTKNILCHDILLNNKNEILTPVDDVFYVLLRVKDKDEKYSIVEMMDQNKKLKLSTSKTNLYRNDWASLWSKKIDFFEEQLNEIKIDKIIHQTIDYYLGLSENAIYYVNSTSSKYNVSRQDNIVLSHKRIYYPNYGLNYQNPLSFIFDLEVRDIAEYIKSAFFAEEDAFLELQTYLKSVRLTPYSYNMFFARLLFPSYYFDCYEKVINKKNSSEDLLKIISKVDSYEKFLKKAYKEISLYAPLEKIDWLIY